MEFRQLLPQPAAAELADLLAEVGGERPGRPYVIVNFVSSIDGRATFHGRSGALGDEADMAMFHGLRELADAILVGTGTLRIEHYGRLLSKPERRERRVAAGRAPEPIACTVTRKGDVPTDVPLFAEPEARVVVYSSHDVDLEGVAAQVELVRLEPEQLTLTTVLRRLHSDHDVRLVLCEGGPSVFGSLLQEGLADELFLTLAPRLTGGGSSPAITNGPELPELLGAELVSALEREGALYLRYRLRQ